MFIHCVKKLQISKYNTLFVARENNANKLAIRSKNLKKPHELTETVLFNALYLGVNKNKGSKRNKLEQKLSEKVLKTLFRKDGNKTNTKLKKLFIDTKNLDVLI